MGTKKTLPEISEIDLPTVAARVNLLHGENGAIRDQVATLAGGVAARAIEIGRLLEEAKSKTKGEFLVWMDSHCKFCERTARNYMRVFRDRQLLAGPNVDNKSVMQLFIAAGIIPEAERVASEKNTDPFHDFWHRIEKIPTWIPKLTGQHRERMRETLIGWLKLLEA